MTSALLCLSCVGVSLPVQAATDPFGPAREAIRRHMEKKDVPGIAVAVWQDGKVKWQEGFGWADMENRVPVTEHTIFNLASLSKTLTAVGVMTLAEAGKVNIDRPVNDYLGPDTLTIHVGNPRDVTVRRVANHTSGLAGGDQFFYGEEAARMPTMADVIHRYGVVVEAPGERYHYSNIGYGVLGHLIERVSGQPYGDYLRREVFMPLGMTHSTLTLTPELQKYQAVRYDFDRKPLPFYYSAEPASAALFSSAHDLARFGVFFLKQRLPGQRAILSDAAIDSMFSDPIDTQSAPVRAADSNSIGYAFGWMSSNQGGYHTVGHGGSSSGVNTQFVMIPSANLGMVLLANADGGVSGLMESVLQTLLPKWRAPVKVAAVPEPAAQRLPAPALLGRWEGTVKTPEGAKPLWLTVQASGEVYMQIGAPAFGRTTLQQRAVLNEVTFSDDGLSGESLAQLVTADTKRYPHNVSIRLKLRDGVLGGTAMAASIYDGRWVYGLPHWVELRKSQSVSAVGR